MTILNSPFLLHYKSTIMILIHKEHFDNILLLYDFFFSTAPIPWDIKWILEYLKTDSSIHHNRILELYWEGFRNEY